MRMWGYRRWEARTRGAPLQERKGRGPGFAVGSGDEQRETRVPPPPAARHPPESRYRCGKVSLPPASKRKWSRTCGKSRSSRPGPAGWAAAGGNRQHRDTGSACRRRPTARPSAGQPRAPGAARSDRTLPPGRGGSGRRGGGNEGSRLEHPPGAPRTGSRSERTKRSSCGERVPIAAFRSAPRTDPTARVETTGGCARDSGSST